MKLNELNNSPAAAASKAIWNRAREVIDTFDLDTELSGTPTEAFSRVLADLDDAQRDVLIEVARRAYKVGAKRGAISALDAVIEGTIELESDGNNVVLTTAAKSIRIAGRTLKLGKSHRGQDLDVPIEKFSIMRDKLGFE